MKRFNTLYLNLMSLFMVGSVYGMDWNRSSLGDPLNQSSLDWSQSSLGQSSRFFPEEPAPSIAYMPLTKPSFLDFYRSINTFLNTQNPDDLVNAKKSLEDVFANKEILTFPIYKKFLQNSDPQQEDINRIKKSLNSSYFSKNPIDLCKSIPHFLHNISSYKANTLGQTNAIADVFLIADALESKNPNSSEQVNSMREKIIQTFAAKTVFDDTAINECLQPINTLCSFANKKVFEKAYNLLTDTIPSLLITQNETVINSIIENLSTMVEYIKAEKGLESSNRITKLEEIIEIIKKRTFNPDTIMSLGNEIDQVATSTLYPSPWMNSQLQMESIAGTQISAEQKSLQQLPNSHESLLHFIRDKSWDIPTQVYVLQLIFWYAQKYNDLELEKETIKALKTFNEKAPKIVHQRGIKKYPIFTYDIEKLQDAPPALMHLFENFKKEESNRPTDNQKLAIATYEKDIKDIQDFLANEADIKYAAEKAALFHGNYISPNQTESEKIEQSSKKEFTRDAYTRKTPETETPEYTQQEFNELINQRKKFAIPKKRVERTNDSAIENKTSIIENLSSAHENRIRTKIESTLKQKQAALATLAIPQIEAPTTEEKLEVSPQSNPAVPPMSDVSTLAEAHIPQIQELEANNPIEDEDEFPLVNLEGLSSIPSSYNLQPAVQSILGETSDKPIELLPERKLGKKPLLVEVLSTINNTPSKNNAVKGKDLVKAVKLFRKSNEHFYFDSQKDYNPEELKTLKRSIIRDYTQGEGVICQTIPFILDQIYQLQLNSDNSTLVQLAKDDLFLCINALEKIGNFKNINIRLINTILSQGALDKTKIQACLVLLGSQCSFYQHLDTQPIHNQLSILRPYYNTQLDAKKIDIATLTNEMIQTINLLALLAPVLSQDISFDTTIDQLETYKNQLKIMQESSLGRYKKEYLKLTEDKDETNKVLKYIDEIIKQKKQTEKAPEPLPLQSEPQKIQQEIPQILVETKTEFQKPLSQENEPSQQPIAQKPQPMPIVEPLISSIERKTPVMDQPEVPQIISDQRPAIQDLAELSNQQLVKGIEALATPLLLKEKTLDQETLNSIIVYADQLIKNKPIINRDTIVQGHFTTLAQAIDLLTKITQNEPTPNLNAKIEDLKKRINEDTDILISQITNRQGRFSKLSLDGIKHIIENGQYFDPYATKPNDILYEAKTRVLDAINQLEEPKELSKKDAPKEPIIPQIKPSEPPFATPSNRIEEEVLPYSLQTGKVGEASERESILAKINEFNATLIKTPPPVSPPVSPIKQPEQPSFFTRALNNTWSIVSYLWNGFISFFGRGGGG